jgi:hypothetical protein
MYLFASFSGDSCHSDSKSMKKDHSDDIISSMFSSLDDGMDDLSIGLMGRWANYITGNQVRQSIYPAVQARVVAA